MQSFEYFLDQKEKDVGSNVEGELFWILVSALTLMYHHQTLSADVEIRLRLERMFCVGD